MPIDALAKAAEGFEAIGQCATANTLYERARSLLRDRLEKLPDAYDAQISESGQNLSGGQRQRSVTRSSCASRMRRLRVRVVSRPNGDTERLVLPIVR